MSTSKQKVLILGTGYLAKDIADLIADFTAYEVIGFVVDQPPFVRGSFYWGKPIYWIDNLEDVKQGVKAICGLARMQKVNFIHKVKNWGIAFTNLVHPSARVSPSAEIGEGVVINSGVQLAADSKIGNFATINRGALIGHDVEIGQYSVVSPGVNIAGNAIIGEKCYLGIGSIILERIHIGTGCFIGAGALVNKDLPPRVKVVGMPARIIQKEIEEF